MCILVGKYFKDLGWVGVKNRDRNYIPEISFHKVKKNNIEIMYFWDEMTQYSEGFNSKGTSVLSASLMVVDDEKEIEKRSNRHSGDGKKIRKSLTYPSIMQTAKSLIKQQLTGNTLIFNSNQMFLLEGAWKSPNRRKEDYRYKIKTIPKDQIVIRTNHGILLPWAGYRRDSKDEAITASRISSESRLLIAEYVASKSRDPEDIIDGLAGNYTNNGQLNALRTSTSKKKMRTTAQILIIPKDRTMYVRPVQSHLQFDFWKLNHPRQKTWVEILSNRILYMNLKDLDPGNDPPFQHRLDHK